jgi:hypothetical protein
MADLLTVTTRLLAVLGPVAQHTTARTGQTRATLFAVACLVAARAENDGALRRPVFSSAAAEATHGGAFGLCVTLRAAAATGDGTGDSLVARLATPVTEARQGEAHREYRQQTATARVTVVVGHGSTGAQKTTRQPEDLPVLVREDTISVECARDEPEREKITIVQHLLLAQSDLVCQSLEHTEQRPHVGTRCYVGEHFYFAHAREHVKLTYMARYLPQV